MKKVGNAASNRTYNPDGKKPPVPIDADEADWLAKEAYEKANGIRPNAIYRYTLGYLF